MRLLRNTILTAFALTAIACSPSYGSVTFEGVNSPPVGVSVREEFIEIPAGVAAIVRVYVDSDNRTEYESDTSIDLLPQDRDVLTVHRRPRRNEFALIGNSPGTTCVELIIDGRTEDCIDTEVTEPEGGT